MRMTIIPSDQVISVNGAGLNCAFTCAANIHAIQVYDGYAEIEYNDGELNQKVTGTDLQTIIDTYQPIFNAAMLRVTPPNAYSVFDETIESWVPDLNLYRQVKMGEIYRAFDEVVRQPVPVEVNGTTYIMDGKEDSASRLNAAISLAQVLGQTTIDIIDYYDAKHPGVSLADALKIVLAQGTFYQAHYYRRADKRIAVNAATSIEELQTITWEN